MIKALANYKGSIKTITSDNGTEFARHKEIATELAVVWFFGETYSSQQCGGNENKNGLILYQTNRLYAKHRKKCLQRTNLLNDSL